MINAGLSSPRTIGFLPSSPISASHPLRETVPTGSVMPAALSRQNRFGSGMPQVFDEPHKALFRAVIRYINPEIVDTHLIVIPHREFVIRNHGKPVQLIQPGNPYSITDFEPTLLTTLFDKISFNIMNHDPTKEYDMIRLRMKGSSNPQLFEFEGKTYFDQPEFFIRMSTIFRDFKVHPDFTLKDQFQQLYGHDWDGRKT